MIDVHRVPGIGAIVSATPAERDVIARALAHYEVYVRSNLRLHDRAENPMEREAFRRELLAVSTAQTKVGPVVWTEHIREEHTTS